MQLLWTENDYSPAQWIKSVIFCPHLPESTPIFNGGSKDKTHPTVSCHVLDASSDLLYMGGPCWLVSLIYIRVGFIH
ncbi:unnamed protein product [Sphenostylis stenocarpa]|uniref:Uncharacterized protein n=1 Tax=Sphenostylis stenocarpa TaxID=92480 RepID=A0AA86S9K9_9FABA|nr:unnamed protein product [Sphenostylis stenocarpa]